MKRSIWIAVAAVALGAPLAPAAAPERDAYRGGYGRGDVDRGREYDRDHDRGGYREHHGEHLGRFIVHYRLGRGSHRLQAKSHDRAHRIVAFLESIGADAHLEPGRVVCYRMRGEREIARHSHEDAHRLAQKLEGYGFRAHVDHE